jgi:hypothetical protein
MDLRRKPVVLRRDRDKSHAVLNGKTLEEPAR